MSTREDVRFVSGDSFCAAWLYRPAGTADTAGPVPCVVMGHGFSLTRYDGLDAYARAFAAVGAAVLVIDYRHLGDSGGEPRQRFRSALQVTDLTNAVAFARGLEGVDPDRVVLWGYSFGGGEVTTVAAADPRLAGLILTQPFLDGRWRLLKAVRTSPAAVLRIVPRAAADLAGSHRVIPVTGPPGTLAAMAFPHEAEGFAAATGADSPWRNEISPGVLLTVGLFRPVRLARRIACPVWLGLGERDETVSAAAIERFAADAPRAELHRYDTDHFEPFHGPGQERVAADQAAWLAATVVAR